MTTSGNRSVFPVSTLALTLSAFACAHHSEEMFQMPLLTEDGRAVHIESYEIAASQNGDMLLLGRYNFVFRRDATGNWQWDASTNERVLGALLEIEDDSVIARLIEAPFSMRRIRELRAVALDNERFAITFAELPEYEGNEEPDSAQALWYGTVDVRNVALKNLERIPLPDSGTIIGRSSSSLIKFGDTLAWALTYETNEWPRHVALFTYNGRSWSHEIIPTRFATYPEITYSDPLGIVFAGVYPDPSPDIDDGNSLFLWACDSIWHSLGKIIPSQTGQVHDEAIEFRGDTVIISWLAANNSRYREARMLKRAPLYFDSLHDMTILDSATRWPGNVQEVDTEEGKVWIIDHPLSEGTSELRFICVRNGKPEVAYTSESPFYTPFKSTKIPGTDTFLLVGTTYEDSPITSGSSLQPVTLVARLSLRCP